MRGITRDTFAELLDQKIIWVIVILTLLAILLASASRSIDIKMQVDGADVDALAEQAAVRAMNVVDLFLAFLIFLVVMSSASSITHMLERGRADYFLSKPVSRTFLFLTKLTSVWLVYGGLVLLAGFLVYLTFSMVDQSFAPGILMLIGIGALQILVWLSITFAAGVFSGSTALAIVSAFMIWMFQFILTGREAIKMFFNSNIASTIVDTLYYILPKSSEMSKVGVSLAIGQPVETWVPVWTSALFGLVLVIVTLVYLKRKDY